MSCPLDGFEIYAKRTKPIKLGIGCVVSFEFLGGLWVQIRNG